MLQPNVYPYSIPPTYSYTAPPVVPYYGAYPIQQQPVQGSVAMNPAATGGNVNFGSFTGLSGNVSANSNSNATSFDFVSKDKNDKKDPFDFVKVGY